MVEALAARVRPFQQLDRAVDGRAFLVAGDEEGDSASWRAVPLQIGERGGDGGGEPALHVDRAAAPEHVVGDLRRERIEAPAGRLARRHHVRVAGEHEARPGIARLNAAYARIEVVDVGIALL